MLPHEFIQRIRNRFTSAEADDFLNALEEKPVVSVRLNPHKLNREEQNLETVPWCPLGRFMSKRPEFIFDPLFHAGSYYVQESSSMFIEKVIQKTILPKNASVLDLCASPGGKATHLLACLPSHTVVTANEVIRTRIPALKENIQRWGYPNVIITNSDPSEFEQFPEYFDLILTDAPCSGEGMFRKDHAARNHWNADNLQLCEMRQARILESAAKALKTGGYLIYSTCTFNPGENDAQVSELLKKGFEFVPVLENSSEYPEIDRIQSDGKAIGYAFYPHKVRGEGFFVSLLRKTKDDNYPTDMNSRFRKPYFSKKIQVPADVNYYLIHPHEWKWFERNDSLYALPEQVEKELSVLESGLQIVYAGVCAGIKKGDDFYPDHALALSIHLNPKIQKIELTREEALQYLKKETLRTHSVVKGIYKVTFENHVIGWVKAVPGRLNNLLPMEFRIRKNLDF